jgi:hypothetical protein
VRALIPLSILAAVAFGIFVLAQNPEPLGGAKPETFGDQANRICAVEAGRSKRDQEDCVYKRLLGKAFEMQNADYNRRLRDASR